MAGSILIVDSVSTNRIVHRVKLIATQYQVFTATTCDEARKMIAEEKPYLMLLNMSDPTEDTHQFCTSSCAADPMGELAIVAIGLADTKRARSAAAAMCASKSVVFIVYLIFTCPAVLPEISIKRDAADFLSQILEKSRLTLRYPLISLQEPHMSGQERRNEHR